RRDRREAGPGQARDPARAGSLAVSEVRPNPPTPFPGREGGASPLPHRGRGLGEGSLARRWYALLVCGSAAFTLFGSLVPFEFRDRPWGDATAAFARAMTERPAEL